MCVHVSFLKSVWLHLSNEPCSENQCRAAARRTRTYRWHELEIHQGGSFTHTSNAYWNCGTTESLQICQSAPQTSKAALSTATKTTDTTSTTLLWNTSCSFSQQYHPFSLPSFTYKRQRETAVISSLLHGCDHRGRCSCFPCWIHLFSSLVQSLHTY